MVSWDGPACRPRLAAGLRCVARVVGELPLSLDLRRSERAILKPHPFPSMFFHSGVPAKRGARVVPVNRWRSTLLAQHVSGLEIRASLLGAPLAVKGTS